MQPEPVLLNLQQQLNALQNLPMVPVVLNQGKPVIIQFNPKDPDFKQLAEAINIDPQIKQYYLDMHALLAKLKAQNNAFNYKEALKHPDVVKLIAERKEQGLIIGENGLCFGYLRHNLMNLEPDFKNLAERMNIDPQMK